MKTYKNLYPKITDWHNLLSAWRKARRGKRYTPAAASFERNLDRELLKVQAELEKETYQPGNYVSFMVHEPKRRKISAAPFRDRVVHHALCNIIEPFYERKFIFDSCANRKGKGTHNALDRCTYFMRRYPYVLQCDVKQFFPAIDHEILKHILSQTMKCKPAIYLCEKIIDSGTGILDEKSSQPAPTKMGITFLGFRVFPDHRRLKRSKMIHYRKHLKKLIEKYQKGEIEYQKMDASVQAWIGHASYGDTWKLRMKLLGEVVS
ncbi:MAG: hypothetical protein JEZ06_03785 [Anaerolineaceae bacterium]|nr:hypothetical protein [Anaerolineaceae bacterium]